MDGLELAARFSYITNSLHFCGPANASKHLLNYIKQKNNEKNVEKSLNRFEGLYPYLSAIAEKNNKHVYDYKVVEAYWIGNEFLNKFEDEDIKKIMKKLMQRGLPKSIGNELIKKLPSGFAPHHNFNVFYVGVGKVTGAVETTLQNMDNCRISSGKVVEVLQNKLFVKTQPLKKINGKFALGKEETKTQSLKKINGKFALGKEETKTAVFLPQMLPDIKKKNIVALHWGFAPLILTNKQLKNLKKYTQLILDVMNKT